MHTRPYACVPIVLVSGYIRKLIIPYKSVGDTKVWADKTILLYWLCVPIMVLCSICLALGPSMVHWKNALFSMWKWYTIYQKMVNRPASYIITNKFKNPYLTHIHCMKITSNFHAYLFQQPLYS